MACLSISRSFPPGVSRALLRLMFLSCLAIACGGCSFLNNSLDRLQEAFHGGEQSTAVSARAAEANEPLPQQGAAATELPFELELTQDTVRAGQLTVEGQVRSKTRWAKDDILVRLIGMKDGEEVLAKNFDEFGSGDVSSFVEAGGLLPFRFQIPLDGVADYQVEVLWGEEAARFRPRKAGAGGSLVGAKEAVLQNVRVATQKRNCQESICDTVFTVTGELHNRGTVSIDAAALGIGFIWQKHGADLDFGRVIPENEERAEVADLNLAPGAQKAIRIVIERKIPQRSDGAFVPTMRLLPEHQL